MTREQIEAAMARTAESHEKYFVLSLPSPDFRALCELALEGLKMKEEDRRYGWHEYARLIDEARALRAENERLRMALRRFKCECAEVCERHGWMPAKDSTCAHSNATAALERKPE
jgi:hypothetical protein